MRCVRFLADRPRRTCLAVGSVVPSLSLSSAMAADAASGVPAGTAFHSAGRCIGAAYLSEERHHGRE